MSAGLFLIAILGCGEADLPCQPVRRLDSRYESRAACDAATGAAAAAAGDVDYPLVVAQCVAADAPARLRASEVKRAAGGRADLRVSPLRR